MKRFMSILGLLALTTAFFYAATLTPAAAKAKDMVKAGLAYFKANGKDAALAEMNKTDGKFRDGEYYLFVFDFSKDGTSVCVARGDGNAALIGKDMWATKDPDGKLYIQEFVRVAKAAAGFGWVDYKRTNPETKKIEAKSSYIEKVPGYSIYVGCGFYK